MSLIFEPLDVEAGLSVARSVPRHGAVSRPTLVTPASASSAAVASAAALTGSPAGTGSPSSECTHSGDGPPDAIPATGHATRARATSSSGVQAGRASLIPRGSRQRGASFEIDVAATNRPDRRLGELRDLGPVPALLAARGAGRRDRDPGPPA